MTPAADAWLEWIELIGTDEYHYEYDDRSAARLRTAGPPPTTATIQRNFTNETAGEKGAHRWLSTPPTHEPRPRHSTSEDVVSDTASDTERHADDAYRGHRVVDDHHRPIGKITDVIYDQAGIAKWAVVSPGVFRAEHFLPLDNTYLSLEGDLVVPYDKRTVALAEGRTRPRAVADHRARPRAVLRGGGLTGRPPATATFVTAVRI